MSVNSSQEIRHVGRLRKWVRFLGQMLWRDVFLLLMGMVLHAFILYPFQNYPLFWGENGLFPWTLRQMFRWYIALIGIGYILPWTVRYWSESWNLKQESISSFSHWLRWVEPNMIMRGLIAMVPMPLYILILAVLPWLGVLGIVISFVQSLILMRSSVQESEVQISLFRRQLFWGSTKLYDFPEVRVFLFGSLGLFLILFFQALGMMRLPEMYVIAGIFCGIFALFSLVCEIRFGREWRVMRAWRENRNEEKKQPMSGGNAVFNFYSVHCWTVLILVCFFLPQYRFLLIFLFLLRQFWVLFWFTAASRISIWSFSRLVDSSGRVLVGSFLGMIGIGSLLLALPIATNDGNSIGLLRAAFTATSAVCVTGLNVFDPAVVFNDFGKTVIAILIQCGGLGIMTISFFVAQLLSRNIGIQANAAVLEMTGEERAREAKTLLRTIVIGTFFVELCGVAVLAPYYHGVFDFAWGKSLGYAAFMSISAFCSAGFSMHPDSMTALVHEAIPVYTISVLILIGGLSFLVILTLWQKLRHPKKQPRWWCHTKLVLVVTIPVWLLGGLLFYLLENNVTLAQMNVSETIRNAWFHTVSCRTAGFNTVDVTKMSLAGKLLTMAMMFIGVSPGSTGGGVKVTTVGIFFVICRNWMRGEREATFAGRRLPPNIIIQAGMCTMLMLFLVGIGTFLLALCLPGVPLSDLMFETVSATATVGLTMNVTPQLNGMGMWIVMILMFVGRIGPLALLVSFAPKHKESFTSIDTNIQIG